MPIGWIWQMRVNMVLGLATIHKLRTELLSLAEDIFIPYLSFQPYFNQIISIFVKGHTLKLLNPVYAMFE